MANHIVTTPPGAWAVAGSLLVETTGGAQTLDISSLSIPNGTLCRVLLASGVGAVTIMAGSSDKGITLAAGDAYPIPLDMFAEDVGGITFYGAALVAGLRATVLTFKANA